MDIREFIRRWMTTHPESDCRVHDQDDEGLWWAGPVECWYCGHRHVAVIPIGLDDDAPRMALECSACGLMACHPVEGKDL